MAGNDSRLGTANGDRDRDSERRQGQQREWQQGRRQQTATGTAITNSDRYCDGERRRGQRRRTAAGTATAMRRLVHAQQRALPVPKANLSEKRSGRVSGHGGPDSGRGRGRFEENRHNLKSEGKRKRRRRTGARRRVQVGENVASERKEARF